MSAYSSRSRFLRARLRRAVDGGLVAAQHVARNAIVEALRGGYTSGAFVTGTSTAAVTVLPLATEDGARVGRVGTDLLYNVYWELGHYNVFLRRVVRVEKWRPAFHGSMDVQRAAFERVFARLFGGGGGESLPGMGTQISEAAD